MPSRYHSHALHDQNQLALDLDLISGGTEGIPGAAEDGGCAAAPLSAVDDAGRHQSLADYVTQIVKAAPPLSDTQRHRLAILLRPSDVA